MIAERTARQEALLGELIRACCNDPFFAEHTSDGDDQPGFRDLARMAASELLDAADSDGRILSNCQWEEITPAGNGMVIARKIKSWQASYWRMRLLAMK